MSTANHASELVTGAIQYLPVAVFALVAYVGKRLHSGLTALNETTEAVKREVLDPDERGGKTLRQRTRAIEDIVAKELRPNGTPISVKVEQIETATRNLVQSLGTADTDRANIHRKVDDIRASQEAMKTDYDAARRESVLDRQMLHDEMATRRIEAEYEARRVANEVRVQADVVRTRLDIKAGELADDLAAKDVK